MFEWNSIAILNSRKIQAIDRFFYGWKEIDNFSIFLKCLAGLGVRHLQIILLFSGLFMSYALRTNISVGIVAMVDPTEKTHAVSYLYICV